MRYARLFTPGPTAVPAEVLEAMARPLVHHRTPTFREALAEVTRDLQAIVRTHNPVAVLSASGTGAMEAVVVNLTGPGQKVVVTELGKFSERWRDIARVYGVDVVSVAAQRGEAVAPERVDQAFTEHPDAVAACKMTPAATMEEALKMAVRELGNELDVLIVPHALLTLPVVAE